VASQLGLCHPSLILSDIIIIVSAVMVAIIAFAVGFGRFLNKKPLITVGSGFFMVADFNYTHSSDRECRLKHGFHLVCHNHKPQPPTGSKNISV